MKCYSASLFHARPTEQPVFAFGPSGSGLSSLAMALSMLGYRCCSDLEAIPAQERDALLGGADDRVFDAYVNIGSLMEEVRAIRTRYPNAKFLITNRDTRTNTTEAGRLLAAALEGADVRLIPFESENKWKLVCEHLKCAPPFFAFPEIPDRGQRRAVTRDHEAGTSTKCRIAKRDKSPWVVEPPASWVGVRCRLSDVGSGVPASPVTVIDYLVALDEHRWLLRNDTFTENLALFRPSNVELRAGVGAVLSVKAEAMGVRAYSAGAITGRDRYLFGRFEAVIKASRTPGVVTGIFLHRDSPRQEIDIEIAGNRPGRLLVNVFYNPGSEGARYDYGYRGAPSYVELGFDASEEFHKFAIEWEPCEIRWYVDDRLVHERVEWGPTPIPHLPMRFHINAWPCRSRELAGRLPGGSLETSTIVKSVEIRANRHEGARTT